MTPSAGVRCAVFAVLVLLFLPAGAQQAAGADGQDQAAHDHAKGFVLFLHAEAHRIAAPRDGATLNEDAWGAADVVLTLSRGRFRLFGEYLLSSEEHDLERLQFGYEPIANTVTWLGRYHQPASAWNTEHHHGRYLQTSVTRPSIELWEDEAGPIPQHLTGALVETRAALGNASGLVGAFGAGLGARVERDGLSPFDVLDMHPSGRRFSYAARVGFLPDYFGATQAGLLVSRHRSPVVAADVAAQIGASTVTQTVLGAYADWHHDPWRVVLAAYHVRLALVGAGTRRERFTAGYLQVERQLPYRVTVYGREENGSGLTRSEYLAGVHPTLVLRRLVGGARFELRPRHALSLELARGATRAGTQTEYRLQWSAALP